LALALHCSVSQQTPSHQLFNLHPPAPWPVPKATRAADHCCPCWARADTPWAATGPTALPHVGGRVRTACVHDYASGGALYPRGSAGASCGTRQGSTRGAAKPRGGARQGKPMTGGRHVHPAPQVGGLINVGPVWHVLASASRPNVRNLVSSDLSGSTECSSPSMPLR
jgi:hypothetical protein